MSEVKNSASLHQRISDYLRTSNGLDSPFALASPSEVAELEFELARAMSELRIAQARVIKLKHELEQLTEEPGRHEA